MLSSFRNCLGRSAHWNSVQKLLLNSKIFFFHFFTKSCGTSCTKQQSIEIESKTVATYYSTLVDGREKKVMMTSHKMKWSKSFVPPQLFYFRNFPFGPPKLWVLFSFITGSILNKCWGKYKKRCTYNSSFPFIELFNYTFRQFMYFLVAIL